MTHLTTCSIVLSTACLLSRLTAPSGTSPIFPELTERERDVLRLVADGANSQAIARTLGLAPKTIANHVSNILTKLQIADRAEAIVRARRAGLVPDESSRSNQRADRR